MRTDAPQGLNKKLATDHVACPHCHAPMLIATIEINRVFERVTYRCEPCKHQEIRESEFEQPE